MVRRLKRQKTLQIYGDKELISIIYKEFPQLRKQEISNMISEYANDLNHISFKDDTQIAVTRKS